MSDADIARMARDAKVHAIVARGREMGLALAALGERPASQAISHLTQVTNGPKPSHSPLVLDLSALWAGPLCSHLLHLAGAHVVKVESRSRPDAMRQGDPWHFALLNQGKDSLCIDFKTLEGRAQLLALLERADIVIEAARPRALRQLGIDAQDIVAAAPGKVWITITGHGAQGKAADWVGFGDDCGVAGGLSDALLRASGKIGFVGDAIADPLTGILAAKAAWQAWQAGTGGRISLAMSAVVAKALSDEQSHSAELLDSELQCWAAASGSPWPELQPRRPTEPLQALGQANSRWLAC